MARLMRVAKGSLDAASFEDLNALLCLVGTHDAASLKASGLPTVSALLLAGADANARYEEKRRTPLHCVAQRGVSPASAKALLDGGAEVDAHDDAGHTPLHTAAQMGHASMVRLLLAAGADAGVRDNDDWRALHHAALSGSRETAEALLAAGADPHALDRGGDTPFSFAAQEEQRQVFYALLAHAYPRVGPHGAALLYGICKGMKAPQCVLALQGEPGAPGRVCADAVAAFCRLCRQRCVS
jgi:ankyrin repeat protein